MLNSYKKKISLWYLNYFLLKNFDLSTCIVFIIGVSWFLILLLQIYSKKSVNGISI